MICKPVQDITCLSCCRMTCCQYRWFHTARLKELWRVVSTDDYFTQHVWKSCGMLSVPVISHDTSERVVTCQYQWYLTARLKELWGVVSTSDLTRRGRGVIKKKQKNKKNKNKKRRRRRRQGSFYAFFSLFFSLSIFPSPDLPFSLQLSLM